MGEFEHHWLPCQQVGPEAQPIIYLEGSMRVKASREPGGLR